MCEHDPIALLETKGDAKGYVEKSRQSFEAKLNGTWLGAGGIRTRRPVAEAQVIHSTYRSNRKNRQNRMSKVHGGYTERGSGTFASEYATECATAPDRESSQDQCLRLIR
jgi:hypothetical protein